MKITLSDLEIAVLIKLLSRTLRNLSEDERELLDRLTFYQKHQANLAARNARVKG